MVIVATNRSPRVVSVVGESGQLWRIETVPFLFKHHFLCFWKPQEILLMHVAWGSSITEKLIDPRDGRIKLIQLKWYANIFLWVKVSWFWQIYLLSGCSNCFMITFSPSLCPLLLYTRLAFISTTICKILMHRAKNQTTSLVSFPTTLLHLYFPFPSILSSGKNSASTRFTYLEHSGTQHWWCRWCYQSMWLDRSTPQHAQCLLGESADATGSCHLWSEWPLHF